MLELSQTDVMNVFGGTEEKKPVVDKSDPFYKAGHAIGEAIKAVGEVAAVAAVLIASAATGRGA